MDFNLRLLLGMEDQAAARETSTAHGNLTGALETDRHFTPLDP